ncbi:unnamed protein product, partial [Urochloa humidicola]
QAKRSNGRCITSERDALLSLKGSLLDPGDKLSSCQGEDCCLWTGVHSSNRTRHVIKLNLQNEICGIDNGLFSTILPSWEEIRHKWRGLNTKHTWTRTNKEEGMHVKDGGEPSLKAYQIKGLN